MALILNLETATKNCSVCLADNGKVMSLIELNEGRFSHAEKLHSFILEVLEKSNFSFRDLDAIAVSKGPGSYTGLRIGVSAAKGLCFALDKPLIAISTLKSIAHQIQVNENDLIIPAIDARRMEVYSAVFDYQHRIIREVKAEIIDKDSFKNELKDHKLFIIGDGAEKCKGVIESENIQFKPSVFPSAKEMADLSFQKFNKKQFENLAYFEPYYLKDFIAVKAKKIF